MDCLLLRPGAPDSAAAAPPAARSSKMEDGAARDDACREYQSSLEDLTFNSKPHINMLTILAEENLHCAKDIVAIIEAQISKAPSAEKLPVLYLVDSIVKNVGGEYLAVFAKNLIASFICVFEKVDENTRKSLFKLRSTWDEVFPPKKLFALDVRVNSLDPAWPIKPLPASLNASIHVNPKFLKQSEEPPSPPPDSPPSPPPVAAVVATPVATPVATLPAAHAPQPVAAVSPSSVTQEQLIRQQLLAKQKQLLELQQKKIELELEQTKAQLAGGFVLPSMAPVSAAAAIKPVGQTAPVVRPWTAPPAPPPDTKAPTRDPRLNRAGPPPAPLPKEQLAGKKESAPDRRPAERPVRPEKARVPRKEAPEEKSKSPSPMAKSAPGKDRAADASDGKKDPRLKKRPQDARDDEAKEKKRCGDRKEREEAGQGAEHHRAGKGKLPNGSLSKHDSAEKAPSKGGNARTHARKRTRSRSPASSPKRKERRSPKSRTRSSSPSPSPSHKAGKTRRPRADEAQKPREDRPASKKSQSESRRSKRPSEDRHSESRDSPRGQEAKEPPHRWRSGWDEKHAKTASDETSHAKAGPPRHKPYAVPGRPSTPRTPKHRLSVDANLQIPEALNSASKKDLLRRASKRLESGEISQEDFLNMAHQIKHFFQYQEEKQQRSESWDDSDEFPAAKPLTAPPSAQPRPPGGLDAAELSYYEHKSKLKKTQVTHREDWEGDEPPEEGEEAEPAEKGGVVRKYNRAPRERPSERRSKEREDARPPLAPMIEEYNHGKEFPALKSLPGLRFRRRADPREPSEREWTSPLTERHRFEDREAEQKSGYDAPRRYGAPADSRLPEPPRRPDGAPPPGGKCPNLLGADALRFERERLSPLQKEAAELSPAPRFESPNSEHSDDAAPGPDGGPPHPKSILKARGPLAAVRQHSGSPGHTPPHEAAHPNPRYEGPEVQGPPRSWYEDPSHLQGPGGRFDGGRQPHLGMPERFEGPDGPHVAHGLGRFEGPPHPQGRFEQFGGHMQHFDPPRHFDGMAPGPMGFQQRRYDGPRYDPAHLHFEGQPPRFPPQHSMQPPMRPMAPPYDPSFPMAPQRYPEALPPQYQGGPMAFPSQAGNFNMQPPFNQPGPAPFYNPAAPAVGIQQPVNMLGAMNPTFLPQTSVPFANQTSQLVPTENHFGQVDVNDLLSKLISNGIIKPPQTDAAPSANEVLPVVPAPAPLPQPAPAAEEEEEEEQEAEDEDLPDLSGFSVDDMKQRFESVVTKLYSGNQCCLCSMRFTAAQTDLYADHLDWHFRQNHAGKVAGKKITHRRWYYTLRDWIEFEEIADLEERAKSNFFEKESEEEVQKSQAALKEKEFQSVKATKDQVGESCEICQEAFETYWVEEEEDWFLKDALRVDDKNFHPACFEDYKNTSTYVDATPSPNKLLAEHPLSAFVPKEEEEPASCAAKQEVALAQVKEEEEESELLIDDVQSEESRA